MVPLGQRSVPCLAYPRYRPGVPVVPRFSDTRYQPRWNRGTKDSGSASPNHPTIHGDAASLVQVLCGHLTRKNTDAWEARPRGPCRFPRTRARDLLGRGGICRMGSAFGDCGPSLRSEGRRRGRVRRRSTRRSPAHGSLRIASWARAGWRAPSQANWEVLDAEFAGRCDCRGCHPPVAEDFSYEDALSQWHGEWRCRAGGRVKEGSRFCG